MRRRTVLASRPSSAETTRRNYRATNVRGRLPDKPDIGRAEDVLRAELVSDGQHDWLKTTAEGIEGFVYLPMAVGGSPRFELVVRLPPTHAHRIAYVPYIPHALL